MVVVGMFALGRPGRLAPWVLLVYAVAGAVGIYDYCHFRYCRPQTELHTVCKTKCRPLHNVKLIPPNLEFRQKVVDTHNKFRNRVASGNVTRLGVSTASNMNTLSYDLELEFIISCWLVTIESIGHDRCRGTTEFPYAGQNLYQSEYVPAMGNPDGQFVIDLFIEAYFHEVVHISPHQVDTYDGGSHIPGQTIDRLTQLIWAGNQYVGCAITLVNHSTGIRLLQGCNYGPGGNLVGTRVFKRGKPATWCPPGLKANTKYKALCGEGRLYDFDTQQEGNSILEEFWRLNKHSAGPTADLACVTALLCQLLWPRLLHMQLAVF